VSARQGMCGVRGLYCLLPVRRLYWLRALHRLCRVHRLRELFGTTECEGRPQPSG